MYGTNFSHEELLTFIRESYQFRFTRFHGVSKPDSYQCYIDQPFNIENPLITFEVNFLYLKVFFNQIFDCPAPENLSGFSKLRYEQSDTTCYRVVYYNEKGAYTHLVVENIDNVKNELYGDIKDSESRDSEIYPEDLIAF